MQKGFLTTIQQQQQRNNNSNQTTGNNNNNQTTTEKQQQRNNNKNQTTTTTTTATTAQQIKTTTNQKNSKPEEQRCPAQHAIKLQKQAFQKISTSNLANAERRHFLHTHTHTQIFSNCSRVKNRAENRAQPKTLLNYKNRHSRRSKHKFYKMQREGIFLTHIHNVNLKKPYFYKATPCQRGFAAKCPVHKFRCVFLQIQSSWPGGGGEFVIFSLSRCCHTLPLNAYFYSAKRCGPQTGF